jgi:alcohol dehydrogenase class IV
MRTEESPLERFTYTALPGRVVFGAGAARTRLAPELERLGARRVLLIAAEPELELARALAGDVTGEFSEVRRHVPVEIARRATAAAEGADALLCFGGGSTTGTAKVVALATGLPIVAVPTTYAGSEMTPVWGMTEGRRKTTGNDARVLPRVVVYDPELTTSLPAQVTGPSALNAIAHCVEAFYGTRANPIASLMAEEGIRALSRGVPVAVARPGDLDGRSDTLYGAYLAGAAFAAAGSGIHHKICHILGGAFDLPHADLHGVMIPQVAAYQELSLPDEMARVARALDAPDAGRGLFDLAARIGAPTALRDIGLGAEDLGEAIALVQETFPDARGLLEAAFEGRRPATMIEEAR